MAFFGNDAVNRVNIHYGIQAIAMNAGGVFFLAFLLHAGLSVPQALVALAGIVACRFSLRPIILPLGKRWGLKPLVIVGTVGMAVQYLFLAEVRGANVWLFVYAGSTAFADTLYWPSYHAYFAAIGDSEHRGHQIAAREAIGAIVGIVAPLLGAWALVTAGPRVAFAGVTIVQALAALPLIGAPNVLVKASAPGAVRAARLGLAIFMADGWLAGCFYFVWMIALFVSLGSSLTGYGGAMALAALVGAVVGLFLGRQVDRGGGRRAVLLAYGGVAALSMLRAASVGSPWLAVTANALGPISMALLLPAEMTAVYNLAKASPCPFRFHIVTEGGWDVGCAAGCLVAAALAASGHSLAWAMLLAVPMTGVGGTLLWRYYGDHPDAEPIDVPLVGLTQPPAAP